ncbi:hypothetical protein V6255_00770 [Psychromonas arctica]|uniref:Uncharacterized protein n=1 Tax=Psychromonas arctica TaxID=168275 RepID=A0ABU9H703_9GAMM
MTYFISMLLLLITLSSNADSNSAESSKIIKSKSTEQKTTTQVPHNNGTDGLLKNTIIEPIENFNNLSKKVAVPKAPIPKVVTKEVQQTTPESSAAPTEKQQKIEIKTQRIKEDITIEN